MMMETNSVRQAAKKPPPTLTKLGQFPVYSVGCMSLCWTKTYIQIAGPQIQRYVALRQFPSEVCSNVWVAGLIAEWEAGVATKLDLKKLRRCLFLRLRAVDHATKFIKSHGIRFPKEWRKLSENKFSFMDHHSKILEKFTVKSSHSKTAWSSPAQMFAIGFYEASIVPQSIGRSFWTRQRMAVSAVVEKVKNLHVFRATVANSLSSRAKRIEGRLRGDRSRTVREGR
jgi:hypothetical protein